MFGALLGVEVRKIRTTPARKNDLYEKKAPRCMFGELLEVEPRKICTTSARESYLKVKSVKTPGARGVFGGSKCFSHGRRRDRYVAKYVAGAGVREGCKNVGRRGGFEEGLKRCFSHGRHRDLVLCDVDV